MTGLNRYDILEPCYHYPGDKVMSLPFGLHQLGATEEPLYTRKRMFLWPSEKENTLSSSLQSANLFHIPCVVSNSDFLVCMIEFLSLFHSLLGVRIKFQGTVKVSSATFSVYLRKLESSIAVAMLFFSVESVAILYLLHLR